MRARATFSRIVASSTAVSPPTKRPLPEIRGKKLPPLTVPLTGTVMRVVSPRARSRTKTSFYWLVSSVVRLRARLSKATKRPSAEIVGLWLSRFPPALAVLTLTRSVTPRRRS